MRPTLMLAMCAVAVIMASTSGDVLGDVEEVSLDMVSPKTGLNSNSSRRRLDVIVLLRLVRHIPSSKGT